MNNSIGTRTWNEGKPERITKPSPDKNMSAQDEARALKGKENVGELLNKVTDPNWIDPSKRRREVSSELDKDAFLKLMLTQMKNQDPLNPMDSHQMAAELAQFSSLEQLQNINDSLTGMKKGQDPITNFQTLNFIGKTISSDSTKIARSKGDKNHDLKFILSSDTKSVNINIKDASGKVIKKLELSSLKKGENKISWNGYNDSDAPTPAGNYVFEVSAVDSNDKKVGVKTSLSGKVTGVNFTPEGPVLLIGDQSVRLSDIRKIEDAELKQVGPAPVQHEKKETEELEGAPEAPIESSGLADLKISPKFQAQLASAMKR